MSGDDLSTKARALTEQALSQFSAAKSQGELNGRLIIKGDGKEQHVVYELFTDAEEEQHETNFKSITDFCDKHKIKSEHLDTLSPSYHVFRNVTRGQWGGIEKQMQANEESGSAQKTREDAAQKFRQSIKQDFVKKHLSAAPGSTETHEAAPAKKSDSMTWREKDILSRLSDNPLTLSQMKPEITLAEIKKMLPNLDYTQVVEFIGRFNSIPQETMNGFHKNVQKELISQEIKLATDALSEYNKATNAGLTKGILTSSDSPNTNMGCKQALDWAYDNEKDVLFNALMSRIEKNDPKAYAKLHNEYFA